MKTIAFAITTLASVFAFAHGSAAHQASEAVAVAAKAFTDTQAKEVQRQFASIIATQTGHEQFAVVITLKNQTRFNYACAENEDVDPVVWECTAQ
jgi:hypothetical protein